jgi:hypothetical protein
VASARNTVTDVVDAIASGNPNVCSTLFSVNYMEVVAHTRDPFTAVGRCREVIVGFRGALSLVRIEGVRVAPRKALVQYVLDVGGHRVRTILELVRARHRWLVARALRAAHPAG